jgi:hypothetical protein
MRLMPTMSGGNFKDQTMKPEPMRDILAALTIAAALTVLTLAYFDVLTA